MLKIRQFLTTVIIVALSAAFCPDASAQVSDVKGTVSDSSGEPLIGASILVKGTTTGVITDMDGKYSISAPSNATLVFSYIGCKDSEEAIAGRAVINVTLADDTNLLEEVVVVGYDTQKKVNLTGAVSSLGSETLTNKPIVQASTALQGMMPGVTVTTRGGAPGDDAANIRIRGIGTFGESSAAPLVLIDGVEGDINSVDASQIDQISVLKDAASSAIYGSRAANGVILVTTKRGTSDRASVSYHGYFGWQTPTAIPDLVDATGYMTLSREATENDGGTSIYTDEYIANYIRNNYLDCDNYPITNWQEEVLQGNGFTHNHNITLNASSEKIKNVTSFGYLKQNGIIKNTDFTRYNLRNNMDIQLAKKLQFRLDLSGSYGLRNAIPSQSSVFMFMNARDPLMRSRWSDGSFAPFTGGSVNILPYLDGQGGNTKVHKIGLNAAASLVYKPFEWWTLEGKVAPRFVQNHTHAFVGLIDYHSDPYGTISSIHNEQYNSLTETENRYYYGNYTFTTSFQHKFNRGSYAKLLLGASNESMNQRQFQGYRQQFDYPEYEVLSAGMANETQKTEGHQYRWRLMSFFGRLNYNFKERYLFEANVRFDGSSRFADGKRWGIFPSFSAAWRVTEEPWMQNMKNTLTQLKIRASWGELGNQNIGSDYYPTIQSLTISNISANTTNGDILYPILATNTLANEDITWETSKMFDAGIDLALWNKLSLTADFYHKTTDGILLQLDIPSSIGLGAPFQNAGRVRNIGWELGIGYHDTKGDFNWSVDANLSDVHNTILDMKGTTGGSGAIRNQEGSSVNSIYGYKCLGIARTQEDADWVNDHQIQFGKKITAGDLVYEDIAGATDENGNEIPDGKVDEKDKQIIGSAIPRLTYGANLSFGWKGLQLSVQLQGVGKADAYISSYYTQPCTQGGTFRTEHLDRWTPQTPEGYFPRLSWSGTNNTQTSTFWMGDASYFRIKNVQISYSLPKKWMHKIKLHDITFFANGTNLLTLTPYYQGYDPENCFTNSGDGVTTGAVANNYPLVSTYTFGVDIKF